MPNIRVDVGYTIHDGTEIKFRSPVDCSAITGLIVYYPGTGGNTVSKVFVLADAHGNNVGDIDHLFAEDVVVKVILDVTKGMAFVQNADTNAYLETALTGKAPVGFISGGFQATALGQIGSGLVNFYRSMQDLTIKHVYIEVEANGLELGGGRWMATIYRQHGSLAVVKAIDLIYGNERKTTITNSVVGEWENISPSAFAPSGFGLGGVCVTIDSWNNATKNGYYTSNGNSPDGYWWWGEVFAFGSVVIQHLVRNNDRDNSPLNAYRTIQNGIPTPWEIYSPSKVVVWETASRTSSFEPQTLSLDLSGYDEVLIYSCLEASQNNDYMVVSRCPVGERALAHFTWGDDNVSLHRFAKTSKTGIEFFNAYHGGAVDNASLMPYKIYGIKEVKK